MVRFTEVWGDPFESTPGIPEKLEINREIARAVSTIRAVEQKIKSDPEAHARFREIVREKGDLYDDEPIDVRFFIYAGRRSYIDSSNERYKMWSELRKNKDFNIFIKTYDQIIDAFRDENLVR